MPRRSASYRFTGRVPQFLPVVAFAVCFALPAAGQEGAAALLERYDRFPHAEAVDHASEPVLDYVVGLGAMQKVRGDWRLEDSERLTGQLTRYTWRIVDGFSAEALFEEATAEVEALGGSELLYACEARSCGRSVQWANRVFHQRVLYGTEKSQRYRVYALRGDEREQRLLMYTAARTTDRQYLHMELLAIESGEGAAP